MQNDRLKYKIQTASLPFAMETIKNAKIIFVGHAAIVLVLAVFALSPAPAHAFSFGDFFSNIFNPQDGAGQPAEPARKPEPKPASEKIRESAPPSTAAFPAAPSFPPTSGPFGRNLTEGVRGDDVVLLQKLFVKEGVYPEALITGYFGRLTKNAAIRFQEKYAREILAPYGLKEGTGFVGIGTRVKLNNLPLPAETFSTQLPAPEKTSAGPDAAFPPTAPFSSPTPTPSPTNDFAAPVPSPLFVLPPSPAITSSGAASPTIETTNLGSDINLAENFAISFSLRTEFDKPMTIINRIDAGGAYERFWYIDMANDGRIEAATGDGERFSQIFSSIPVNDGEWHEVEWKRTGDVQTVSIDGTERTQVNYIDPGIEDINPQAPAFIGMLNEGADPWFFVGELKDIVISIDGKTLWSTSPQ